MSKYITWVDNSDWAVSLLGTCVHKILRATNLQSVFLHTFSDRTYFFVLAK